MKTSSRKYAKHVLLAVSQLLLLIFVLAACGGGNGNNNNANTKPTATNSIANGTSTTGPTTHGGTTPAPGNGTSTTGDIPPVAPPGVVLGPRACPDAVKDPAHWDPIIPTQSGTSRVESVTCGNLLGNSTLQALVTVRFAGSGAFLDVYVYNNIISPAPMQLFTLPHLDKGDAKISGYNTVLTAQVDPNSSINAGKDNASLVQDLFREFKWSAGAGTLVQVAFPGFFPDMTRYEAEADQVQVSQGHQPWKLNAVMTAQALAASTSLLKWSPNAPATLIQGGGTHDVKAVVRVKSTKPGSGNINVTMYRLEGNTDNGIWIVTGVESDSLAITSPVAATSISSPVTVTGTGNAFEGQIGRVTVFDHLLTDIGHANAIGAIGMGNTTFSTSVKYNSDFHGGSQEGIVALYAYSNADGSIASAVIVKVLISA
jgi:Immunoglobulin-like domain of bacterial spore germination